MDVHMMAADLDRRFGGQNVFRYLAEGLSDNPNMTGVFDLSRNPSPCRGVGIGSEIAYKDVDARFGEPLRWAVSVASASDDDVSVVKLKKILTKDTYPSLQEKDIEQRGNCLFISTRRIGLMDLRSYARRCKCELVVRLEGVP